MTDGGECHQGPGQQREDPGVGSHVHARGIAAVEERDHRRGRGDEQCERDRGDARGTSPSPRTPDDDGPQEVELLLDGQAPQMLERRGCGEGVPVSVTRRDLVPVGGVELGPWRVSAGHDPFAGLGDQPQHHHDHDQQNHDRGQQSPQATSPESDQIQSTGFGEFADEQRGDEESRECEEQVHAEEAAGQPIVVKREYTDHREGPQAVQSVQALANGTDVTHVVIVGP